jgi:hypothetical protein
LEEQVKVSQAVMAYRENFSEQQCEIEVQTNMSQEVLMELKNELELMKKKLEEVKEEGD